MRSAPTTASRCLLRHRLPGDAGLGPGGDAAGVPAVHRPQAGGPGQGAEGRREGARRVLGHRRGAVSPPPVATARPEVVTEELPRRRQAWIERATSADHKSVGTLYIGAALAFLVAAVAQFVADADAADRSREHPDPARDLQPHHVDVRGHRRGPVRNPAGARAVRLHLPPPDRRPRCRVPAAQPPVLLALRIRRLHHLRQLPVAPLRGRLRGASRRSPSPSTPTPTESTPGSSAPPSHCSASSASG